MQVRRADARYPTEPAFLVPVEVKDAPQYGDGQKGVFASERIPAGKKYWEWTERVEQIHASRIQDRIDDILSREGIGAVQVFLRQGFVLPTDTEVFNSNPTDAGRFMNHADEPSCDWNATLKDLEVGDELTINYSFHADPTWYQVLCAKYGVLTEAEVASGKRS